jgi:NADPH-dependent ferric siderophore reductase
MTDADARDATRDATRDAPGDRTGDRTGDGGRDRRRGGLLDRMMHHATVAEVEQVRPRIRRVRLTGAEVGELPWRPGQEIRVRVDDAGLLAALGRGKARDLLRTYSVVAFDRPHRWLDLCVYQHGEGGTPGLDWAAAAAVGDEVAFLGPQGRLVVREDAAYHLVVGEETAQMAFAAILAALPADARVAGVIQVAGADDRMETARGDELTWVHRGAAPAASSTALLAAVRALDLPEEPGVAYVAGEARAVAAVRRHLVDARGWPRRSVLTKPFWTPGRRGLD